MPKIMSALVLRVGHLSGERSFLRSRSSCNAFIVGSEQDAIRFKFIRVIIVMVHGAIGAGKTTTAELCISRPQLPVRVTFRGEICAAGYSIG
ncbi:MAG: hypothetical protein VB021_08435 [Oscillospiraceae bacterium]|nr:hypothetical protein [Oscillospiraceae bacterium]